MKQIGFKNFRKFADFPAMDLAPITILVGENNAGKSTVVKGILAFSDFLKKGDIIRYGENDPIDFSDLSHDDREARHKREALHYMKGIKFYFNTSYLAHIGTFKRALYNKAKDNTITFYTKLIDSSCTITVSGDPKDEEAVSGTVTTVDLSIDYIRVSFHFDLINDEAIVTFHPDLEPNKFYKSNELNNYFSSFDKQFSFKFELSDYWQHISGDFFVSLIKSVEDAINATLNPLPSYYSAKFNLDFYQMARLAMGGCKPLTGLSPETIDFLKSFANIFSYGGDNEKGNKNEPFHFPGFDIRYRRFFGNIKIEYLYAHAVTQTVIYSAKDTNDYLSRTIHEFASQKDNRYKRAFIKKWMAEFGIGKNYHIQSVGGEAHIVHVINFDGKEVNLADKGMGSIQLMVLLFRLAILLPYRSSNKKNEVESLSFSTAIIEEPEQNLHPMLQSKLADLFYELNKQYGLRFIIETHSEYLVRRSQVIVGDNFDTEEKLKNNPFKVYYFPSEGDPYDMVYTTSGLFEKKFGDGFINEAGKLHMALLKNAKKNQ